MASNEGAGSFTTVSPQHSEFADASSVKSVSSTGTSSSLKRKRGDTPGSKFYAVRAGHKTGVFLTWQECLLQIKGFKKASFKSFPTLKEAEDFVVGNENAALKGLGNKFYAVRNGHIPGVYTDWPSAQKQITGFKLPKHKCFASRAEAEAFVKGGSSVKSDGTSNGLLKRTSSPENAATLNDNMSIPSSEASTLLESNQNTTVIQPPPKKQRKAGSIDKEEVLGHKSVPRPEPGTAPLPPNAEDGFDPDIQLNPHTGVLEYKTDKQKSIVKAKARDPKTTSKLIIYTDGSALGNGRDGSRAGVGVYFGPGDERNVSEPLTGARQTNQRAELTAIQRALEIAPKHRDVEIVTDSEYSINCVTVWFPSWKRNGWLNSKKKPVENRDLIENILDRIAERTALNVETQFRWTKGHNNDAGNEAADRLAVNGAMSN